MSTFITSDCHFGHTNILKYDKRPFASIEEHDSTIIKNWNRAVQPNDSVYYLGDFAFKADIGIRVAEELNGKIYFIKGNHDKALKDKKLASRFEWIKDYHLLKYGGKIFPLFHYAILQWDRCHYGSIHLHGHSHNNIKDENYYRYKVFDVGINGWDYTPINLDKIIELAEYKQIKSHHD